jgi:hypothetical protein
MINMEDKLNQLWADYREAVPDRDASSSFLPRLWQRIDARRNDSISVFRRLAEVCAFATLALALLMAVIIPELQQDPGVAGQYVDALAAEQSSNYAMFLEVDDQL